MVTESFAIVRSGERIAYLDVHENGKDGVNLLYNDELITFRYLEDVTLKSLINDCNLKYKHLTLIVNEKVSGYINNNIKKEKFNKELEIIVEENKIILKNDEFKTESSSSTWFKDIYFYYIKDWCAFDLEEWEENITWGL